MHVHESLSRSVRLRRKREVINCLDFIHFPWQK